MTDLSSTDLPVRCPQWPELGQPKPGGKSFIRVSHVGAGPSAAALPGLSAESWIGNWTTRTQISAHVGCRHCRQQLNMLPHNASSLLTVIEAFLETRPRIISPCMIRAPCLCIFSVIYIHHPNRGKLWDLQPGPPWNLRVTEKHIAQAT